MSEPIALTQEEIRGVLAARAAIMHAEVGVKRAQDALTAAQQQLNGVTLAYGYAHGLTDGQIEITPDGTAITRR